MARRWLTAVVVCLASAGAGVTALASLRLDRELSVGTMRIFSDPGHRGALDLYVPLVDWGVRFGGVRMPARLHLDVRTVDRKAAARVASGGEIRVKRLRAEATDSIAAFLRVLALVVAAAALLLGGLTALALRRPR